MAIIRHDFGLGRRSIVRRFRSLLRLDALHEVNIRANPLPYLERASEKIYRLERVLFEAATAAKPAAGGPNTSASASGTIEVNRDEYLRLKACLAIVESGLAELASDENEV